MTAASGADQPTLRDQLAEYLRHHQGSAETADELAAVLLPFVERAKAEAAAEALEQAAGVAESEAAYDDQAPDELQPRRLFAARLRQLAANLRFDADVLRATTGQPPDGPTT